MPGKGSKNYRGRHKLPDNVDRARLMQTAQQVCPAIAAEVCRNIVDRVSYDALDKQTAVGINRSDFYGYRRRVIDRYAEGGGALCSM